MTYDQWKTDSGYDERDECYHEDFEPTWEGRAHCNQCGASWWMTPDEIAAERAHRIEYDRWCRQQERREFWKRITLPIRWPIYRLLERIWPRKSCSVLTDDEIPF
jgi:hypothetical protein